MMDRVLSRWASRSIFISSTFADMHCERDYLRTHAFAELAELLHKHRHYLEPIDLRQGVETIGESDEGEREAKVLNVCLDEIERARPFFVGILGDRYGWMPSDQRLEQAALSAGFSFPVSGKSVTELEILYGVLDNPDLRGRSWFYLRELDYTGMPEELRKQYNDQVADDSGAEERVHKLEELKRRLKKELPDYVRTYKAKWDPVEKQVVGLESLSEMVKADLWPALEIETELWLRDSPDSWREEDARVLEDFIEGRVRGFVDRESVSKPLLDHALSSMDEISDWGICLTGKEGAGKSSLFSGVCRQLEHLGTERNDLVILTHATGIYPRSSNVDALLHRWIHELTRFLEIDNPLESGTEFRANRADNPAETDAFEQPIYSPPTDLQRSDLDEIFGQMLQRAAQRARIVLVIDAINGFEPSSRARYLTWLPKFIPQNVRLIVTSTPGVYSLGLEDREGVQVMKLPALEFAQANGIAQEYYRQFHREPNARAMAALLERTLADGTPAYGSPLWLELALHEMNLLSADDFARAEREFSHLPGAERSEALQAVAAQNLPTSPREIYGRLIRRSTENFGRDYTTTLLNLIALGREGWRESDLRILVSEASGQKWDELNFAGVRRIFGCHIVQRGGQGQWNFSHQQLRNRIFEQELSDTAERLRLHRIVVDYLDTLPPEDPIRISEYMHHALDAFDQLRAALYYGGANLPDAAVVPATQAIFSNVIQRGTTWFSKWLRSPELTGLVFPPFLTRSVNHLLPTLSQAIPEKDLLPVINSLIRPLRSLLQSNPKNDAGLAYLTLLRRLANSEFANGNLQAAKLACTNAITFGARILDQNATSGIWAVSMAETFSSIGEIATQCGDAGNALWAFGKSVDLLESVHTLDPENTGVMRQLSKTLSSLAEVQLHTGKVELAVEGAERAIDIASRLVKRDDHDPGFLMTLALALGGRMEIAMGRSQYDEARSLMRRIIEARTKIVDQMPDRITRFEQLVPELINLGGLAIQQQEYGEAESAFSRAEEITNLLPKRAAEEVSIVKTVAGLNWNLGCYHRIRGLHEEANQDFRNCHEALRKIEQSNAALGFRMKQVMDRIERCGPDDYASLPHG